MQERIRVPLDYINKNKINLYTAKDVYSIPMAEWVVLKILEIYKSSNFFRKKSRKQALGKEKGFIRTNRQSCYNSGECREV